LANAARPASHFAPSKKRVAAPAPAPATARSLRGLLDGHAGDAYRHCVQQAGLALCHDFRRQRPHIGPRRETRQLAQAVAAHCRFAFTFGVLSCTNSRQF
jgi:hypothetical protein